MVIWNDSPRMLALGARLEAMGLAPGQTCHAVIKSVAVAPDAIGTGLRASPASRD